MNREEIIEWVLALSTTDLRALGEALSEAYGREIASQLLFGTILQQATPTHWGNIQLSEPEGETMTRVVLENTGHQKIHVIKVIRDFTHFGLKDSKDITDAADGWTMGRGGSSLPKPVVIDRYLPIETAREFVAALLAVGASARLEESA